MVVILQKKKNICYDNRPRHCGNPTCNLVIIPILLDTDIDKRKIPKIMVEKLTNPAHEP